MILVLFLLPAALYILDKPLQKSTYKAKFVSEKTKSEESVAEADSSDEKCIDKPKEKTAEGSEQTNEQNKN